MKKTIFLVTLLGIVGVRDVTASDCRGRQLPQTFRVQGRRGPTTTAMPRRSLPQRFAATSPRKPDPKPLGKQFSDLQTIALESLKGNTVKLRIGSIVTAGRHQFGSAWTRDFLSSVRGLLAAGKADVVKTQLTELFENVRPSDGLLPRSLDSMDTRLRVIYGTISWFLPRFLTNMFKAQLRKIAPPINENLKPEYQDQYGSIAIDGNALAILSAYRYATHTGDTAWLKQYKPTLLTLFHFYDQRKDQNGLISQPKFSDWKDSLERQGPTFFTNVLYQMAGQALAKDHQLRAQINLAELRNHAQALHATFFDPATGLYRSTLPKSKTTAHGWFGRIKTFIASMMPTPTPTTDLDDNLVAIDVGFVTPESKQARALYRALKKSVLWPQTDVPGAVTPKYPTREKSLMVRLVGLAGYHDQLYWSWIMAKAAKVAHQMGDTKETERILQVLDRMAQRDQAIAEVYEPSPEHKRFQSWAYESETPFLAGSAAVLETLFAIGAK